MPMKVSDGHAEVFRALRRHFLSRLQHVITELRFLDTAVRLDTQSRQNGPDGSLTATIVAGLHEDGEGEGLVPRTNYDRDIAPRITVDDLEKPRQEIVQGTTSLHVTGLPGSQKPVPLVQSVDRGRAGRRVHSVLTHALQPLGGSFISISCHARDYKDNRQTYEGKKV